MILSVIVPCYNEKFIKRQTDIIKAYLDEHIEGADYEIIVVNDGSSFFDFKSESEKIRVLSYEKNRGKGYAVKTGLKAATGDLAVFMDCDLATDLSAVDEALAASKKADIVVGNRYHKNSASKRTFIRRFVSKCLNILQRVVLGIKLSDTQCGFKMLSRTAYQQLAENQQIDGFAFDLEYLYLARLFNLKVIDIPVMWHENDTDSTVNFKKSLRFVFDIFEIKRIYRKKKA